MALGAVAAGAGVGTVELLYPSTITGLLPAFLRPSKPEKKVPAKFEVANEVAPIEASPIVEQPKPVSDKPEHIKEPEPEPVVAPVEPAAEPAGLATPVEQTIEEAQDALPESLNFEEAVSESAPPVEDDCPYGYPASWADADPEEAPIVLEEATIVLEEAPIIVSEVVHEAAAELAEELNVEVAAIEGVFETVLHLEDLIIEPVAPVECEPEVPAGPDETELIMEALNTLDYEPVLSDTVLELLVGKAASREKAVVATISRLENAMAAVVNEVNRALEHHNITSALVSAAKLNAQSISEATDKDAAKSILSQLIG